MAERLAARWLWDARAREDSHARQAVGDSNSVSEQTLPRKQGALTWRVAVSPRGKPPRAQKLRVAPWPEPEARQVLEGQEELLQVAWLFWEALPGVVAPILLELAKQEKQVSPQ
jgi:hypothetical protein